MKRFLLFLFIGVLLFFSMQFAYAKHWGKVAAVSADIGTSPTLMTNSKLRCQSFAIWEDTKTMTVTVYLGLHSDPDVFSTTILPGEILEINYQDKNLQTEGIYISTTSTAKINYLSRVLVGW